MKAPREQVQEIAAIAESNLRDIIAIDSQSCEDSESIPSTPGQAELASTLRIYFSSLGFEAEVDGCANLLVEIPASPERKAGAAIVLMAHLDTSEGTRAVSALDKIPSWDGSRIPYSSNSLLNVTSDNYSTLESFVGHDILHGPGDAPVGFDDKVGIAILMTLAKLLTTNPQIPHGRIVLAFRPDEEIGRMSAVEGLADSLAKLGVSHGYTIDGIEAFEVNVENFNASQADVFFDGEPLDSSAVIESLVEFRLAGVETHGSSAKSEGHVNSTSLFVDALARCRPSVIPLDFQSDPSVEVNARGALLLRGDSDQEVETIREEVVAAFGAAVEPHAWKGAQMEIRSPATGNFPRTDAALKLVRHLRAFLASRDVAPLLAEESSGFQGYSNPFFVRKTDTGLALSYRLRDFDPEQLRERENHIIRISKECGDRRVETRQQYINMGDALKKHPHLVTRAQEAIEPLNHQAKLLPIRGGTGVDPFLERGIPIANLGTGYWAAESPREITSVQYLALHSRWLLNLVQIA